MACVGHHVVSLTGSHEEDHLYAASAAHGLVGHVPVVHRVVEGVAAPGVVESVALEALDLAVG